MAQYRKALEIEPRLPGARRALAVALMNSSSDEPNRIEAQRQFEQELSLNPGDALSEYQLGELMWIGNRPGDAIKRFLRAIELQPNFADALIAAGKVLVSTAKPEETIPLLEKSGVAGSVQRSSWFRCEFRSPPTDKVDRCQSRRPIHSKDVTTPAR